MVRPTQAVSCNSIERVVRTTSGDGRLKQDLGVWGSKITSEAYAPSLSA